jgi:hypothetical protein
MSTPVNADNSSEPRVKVKGISRTAMARLRARLGARHWNAGASLEPLLRRGGALQQACAKPRFVPRYSAALATLVDRWGSQSIDDLSYETVVAWYQQLQTAPVPTSGQRTFEIHNVLETTLRMAAIERDANGSVTAMTRSLMPVWRLNGGGVGALNAIASSLMRRSGRRGAADSLAMSLPTERAMDLWMVSGRLHLSDSIGPAPKLRWSCSASEVESISKAPRLQLLSRVTIRFTDGSRASFMTQKRFALAATRVLAPQ